MTSKHRWGVVEGVRRAKRVAVEVVRAAVVDEGAAVVDEGAEPAPARRLVHADAVQDDLFRPIGAPASFASILGQDVVMRHITHSAIGCVLRILWSTLVGSLNRKMRSHQVETVMDELLFRALFSSCIPRWLWNETVELRAVTVLEFDEGKTSPAEAARLFGFSLTKPQGWEAEWDVFHTWTSTHTKKSSLFAFRGLRVKYFKETGRLTICVDYSVHSPSGNEIGG